MGLSIADTADLIRSILLISIPQVIGRYNSNFDILNLGIGVAN